MKPSPREPELFAGLEGRRRRALIQPKFLADEADNKNLNGDRMARAFDIMKKWAGLEKQGILNRKETAIDAGYLQEVFCDALGYQPITQNHERYHLERQYSLDGGGFADAALGDFSSSVKRSPIVVVELKGALVDLDRDKTNGRTPVQQCWDYLNDLPNCPFGIVSNFVTIRLYHRDRTPLAFQEFKLQDLHKEEVFRQFYCLFERTAFIPIVPGQQGRAFKLLDQTASRQRDVGDELYTAYSNNRYRLIEHLHRERGKSLELAIHIAQKILDRIIFIAFCEDRGLLPVKCLDKTYYEIPMWSRATNPKWRNFLDLFHAIDKGHVSLALSEGYNGGLFRHDPEVDDLQLDDSWTNFFKTIGTYDFRDEVNVDVLGHLFEKSVGELEKLRTGGLFENNGEEADKPAMQKSAARKRLGIYYTPPDFTKFIVDEAVGKLIDERFDSLLKSHKLKKSDLDTEKPSARLAEYWRACLNCLKEIRICDPACGSGAFLIQAFDSLEERYAHVIEHLAFHEESAERPYLEQVADSILALNLYGVDLSEQGVEITQLALWLRSAKKNKTLADLSRNIIWGNSLVTDPAVSDKAMVWREKFADVFNRPESGFDCVIGNPPWERIKLQEREFFAHSAPKIAGAVNAAERRRLIESLKTGNAELYELYAKAKNSAERTSEHVRAAGEFPLTARGDINTYILFAELARKLVASRGRVGLLVPSGIATDHTTREFFADLISSQALAGLYDFENRLGVFPDVDGRFKFCAIVFGGALAKNPVVDFVFFAHKMQDLESRKRHIPLSAKDIALLNPNTLTCPIFRSREDAELTKAIYRRVPVLIDRSRREGGNPWGIKFATMFHQTNDAELFQSPIELKKKGYSLIGNHWVKGKERMLPLYEAKMVQAFDHRAASVLIEEGNWVRQGQTEGTSAVQHQNPEFVAQPRWWVAEAEVAKAVGCTARWGFVGFKDISSPTNTRTMIAAAIPWVAVTNHFPLIETSVSTRLEMCLLANLNSMVLDYVVRQKIGGVTLNFFIVEQLPILSPETYSERCPWAKKLSLEQWICERVLRLSCTSEDLMPLAQATTFDPPIRKWNPAERALLCSELDAAFLVLYGIKETELKTIFRAFGMDATQSNDLFNSPCHPAMILDAYERFRQKIDS